MEVTEKCSGKKSVLSVDSEVEREMLEQKLRRNRAELKKQMSIRNYRKNINENILVDSQIMSMVRKLKKQKLRKRQFLLKKLRERRNRTPKKMQGDVVNRRKNMTPKRRMVRKISSILPSKNFKEVFKNSLL